MTAVRTPSLISIADYLEGENTAREKHEYVAGTVHSMAGGSNRHNTIAGNAFATLHAQLRGKPCRPFNSDTKVRIELPDHLRFYYPDAMVVCSRNPDSDHYQQQPVVLIEVLSDTTRRIDLGEKRDAYRTIPSLKVLIFVESDAPDVRVLRRQAEGGFADEHYSGTEAVIALSEIDAHLRLSELYASVDLAL